MTRSSELRNDRKRSPHDLTNFLKNFSWWSSQVWTLACPLADPWYSTWAHRRAFARKVLLSLDSNVLQIKSPCLIIARCCVSIAWEKDFRILEVPWKLLRATQFESGGRQRDRRNHSLFRPQNPVYLPNNALARSRQHRHPAKEEDSALSPKARRQKLGNINSCKGAKEVGVKNSVRVGWRNLRSYSGLVSLSYSSYSFHTQGARDLLWAILKYRFWKFFTVTRALQKGRVFPAGSSLRGGKIYRLATNVKASDRTRKKKPQPGCSKVG